MTERKCWCSTFAICECALCGQPLCGDHRYWRADRWHCRDDALAIDREAERVAEAAASAEELEEQARLARLADIADPIERLLREIAPRSVSTGNSRPEWDSLAAAIEAAGSYGRVERANPCAWASEKIAAWFAERAMTVPFDAQLPELGPSRRRLIGGSYTQAKVLGQFGLWLFPRGGDLGPYGCKGVAVVQDGRLVWAEAEAAGFLSGPAVIRGGESGGGSYQPCLNESGLIQIARRLGY